MEYEPSKPAAVPSYLDSLDSSFNYMDNANLDYLQHLESSSDALNLGALSVTSSPMGMEFGLPVTEAYGYTPSYGAPSPPHQAYSPPEEMSSPPMAYPLSGAALSDGLLSRASRSPPAFAAVPRSQRFNPIAVPANRAAAAKNTHKRRQSRQSNDESDDDDEDFTPGSVSNAGSTEPANRDSRRETVRKQRIESEQRRRDELREGYARLKETLPASNQKASKVSLLDRATSHIKYLEAVKDQLEARLKGADTEVHRLRSVNEALMLNRAGAAAAAAALVGSRKFGKAMPAQQLS